MCKPAGKAVEKNMKLNISCNHRLSYKLRSVEFLITFKLNKNSRYTEFKSVHFQSDTREYEEKSERET